MPLSTGQVLKERYRIVRLLGQGGFGAVYRAWDTVLERPCALKENLDPHPAAERQFEREAKILARLKHPNLPDVKDYFVLPGQGQYLVMDFVEGEDLEKLLARAGGRLPEAQVVGWIEQVCRALEYLHSQTPPVIHRDIKPANIKITPQGQAVLVDFGIAKFLDTAVGTLSGAHAATPGYAPFEQYGTEPTDARSDIYSLGATLYCLLTGVPPLESIARVKGRTLENPRQLNPRITPRTEQVILKALALHPEGRYQRAEEFRLALRHPSPTFVERDEAKVAPTVQVAPLREVRVKAATEVAPAPVSPQHKPARFHPAAIGLIVIGLVVLVVLVWLLANLLIVPAPTSPPSSRALDTDTSFSSTIATEAQIIITIPPQSTSTAMLFTPTARLVPTPALSNQIEDPKGVPMALVPAGEFLMGSDPETGLAECQKFRSDCQRDWFTDEQPVHLVDLDAFYIDVYEVTNALYEKCVQAGTCSVPRDTTYYDNTSYAQHPVVYVDWNQARAYCHWRGGDLPSEAQWEKAARGGLERKSYPWGDEAPSCTPGAINGAQFYSCGGGTVDVGSFGANGYGLYDMAGNVWEWVLDWYQADYYASSPSANPRGAASGYWRALRGGSWFSSGYYLRVAYRLFVEPGGRSYRLGFRCSFSP